MAGTEPSDKPVALSDLPAEQKAQRAGSFGAVAGDYERYRPGPPLAAVDWLAPSPVSRIVDLGAGTGALTRLLIGRADEVVAVEPDDRMRAVLVGEVPEARAVSGRGEAIPLPDGSVDAVLASSSWHWMDPVPTLHEVGRVLVPGGILGALWSGPDPDSGLMAQARVLFGGGRGGDDDGSGPAAGNGDLGALVLGDADRPSSRLEIPPGVPFDQPEQQVFSWEMAMDADDIIGLLGTLSWMITMAETDRGRVFEEVRRVLREALGVEGDVTLDVPFRCEVWRARRHDA